MPLDEIVILPLSVQAVCSCLQRSLVFMTPYAAARMSRNDLPMRRRNQVFMAMEVQSDIGTSQFMTTR